jgi:hypothetical protein
VQTPETPVGEFLVIIAHRPVVPGHKDMDRLRFIRGIYGVLCKELGEKIRYPDFLLSLALYCSF